MPPRIDQKRMIARVGHEMRALLGVAHPRLRIASAFAGLLPDFSLAPLRLHAYRAAGCDLAPQVAILGQMHFVGAGAVAIRLHVGEASIIGPEVTFGLDAEITIGKNVSIGPKVTFHTASHALGFGSRRMNPTVSPRAIVVEDGAWIGAHAVVLPGVRVGRGSVASAGAVLTEDVPPNSLVSGNPAVVRETLAFGQR